MSITTTEEEADPARPLRIIYAGTPDFSVPALQALINSVHEVVAVYSKPDRPVGRGRKIVFNAVKQQAIKAGIVIEQPESLKTAEAQATLRAYNADIMVVAAYGLLLPQAVLDTPTYGCLNIHGSLLPRWRGAAPIQRAIIAGDTETGITIMQMDKGLDTGNMLYKSAIPIRTTDTGQTIHDALAEQGAIDIMHIINKLSHTRERLQGDVQDEQLATYAHKLNKKEAQINWQESAQQINNQIRAFTPWPMSYTYYHGKPMKIHHTSVKAISNHNNHNGAPTPTIESIGSVIKESKAGIEVCTGDGILVIHRLQMPGKKAMDVANFLNGHSLEGIKFQ